MVPGVSPIGVVQEGPSEYVSPEGAKDTAWWIWGNSVLHGGNSKAQALISGGPELEQVSAGIRVSDGGWSQGNTLQTFKGDRKRREWCHCPLSPTLSSGDRWACPSLQLGSSSNLLGHLHQLCKPGTLLAITSSDYQEKKDLVKWIIWTCIRWTASDLWIMGHRTWLLPYQIPLLC